MVDSDVSDDASRTDKAPPTAGQILKSAREAKEISADRLARALNLDVPAVRAIESDRYAVIGAPVFVRGHLRKYAQLVDISADEGDRHPLRRPRCRTSRSRRRRLALDLLSLPPSVNR